MTTTGVAAAGPRDRLELAATGALMAFVAVVQLSIAASGILLTAATLCWLALLVTRRERVLVPPIFWPLAAYGGYTIISAAFSIDPVTSFGGAKQIVLFIVVLLVYRLAPGPRASTLLHIIISVGAITAAYGIVQYGILQYDHLGRRPQGPMGHYMTYSGLVMLVVCAALARVLFRKTDRTWPALVLPALLVALALTFTRSAWVGVCVATALLLSLRDFRLLAALPVVAALFFAVAPGRVTDRVYSMFDLNDPTNRDRVAMARSGFRMIADHPLTGVGPNMVLPLYEQYRDPLAVEEWNPHLHNVPLQIAAERGLPALAIWIWFIVAVVRELAARLRVTPFPWLAAGGLAAVAAMLGAGLFEYNFGDSEFLMLFLILITLPLAADREAPRPARPPALQ